MSMAYDELSSSTLEVLPILALKCKDCGKTFMAHALAYPIDEDTAVLIAESVRHGDIPYICTETKFGCTCDKPYLEGSEDDE